MYVYACLFFRVHESKGGLQLMAQLVLRNTGKLKVWQEICWKLESFLTFAVIVEFKFNRLILVFPIILELILAS